MFVRGTRCSWIEFLFIAICNNSSNNSLKLLCHMEINLFLIHNLGISNSKTNYYKRQEFDIYKVFTWDHWIYVGNIRGILSHLCRNIRITIHNNWRSDQNEIDVTVEKSDIMNALANKGVAKRTSYQLRFYTDIRRLTVEIKTVYSNFLLCFCRLQKSERIFVQNN